MHDVNTDRNGLADLGYEARDVSYKPLIMALFGLIGLIVVSILGIMWFYDFTSPRYTQDIGKPRWETEHKVPPHPQLQVYPKEEMSLYIKAEDPYRASVEKSKAAMASKGISGIADSSASSGHDAGAADFPGSGNFAKTGAVPSSPVGGGH